MREPTGREHDDFFFTTDIHAAPAAVVAEYAYAYADRWSIEVTFREVKQHPGNRCRAASWMSPTDAPPRPADPGPPPSSNLSPRRRPPPAPAPPRAPR